MNRPALKLVDRPPEPEDALRCLFRREAKLLRELAVVRSEQREQARRYAEKHRLMMLPRLDRLRDVLGPLDPGLAPSA